MRKTILLFLAFSIAAPALASAPGGAQNFLERAERLKAKGPFAFFDSERPLGLEALSALEEILRSAGR